MTTTMLELRPLPRHLSYSQVSSIKDCGERFRLERLFKVPQAPSWALVGGGAIHTGTELLDFYAAGKFGIEVLPNLTQHSEDGLVESTTEAGEHGEPGTDQPGGRGLRRVTEEQDELLEAIIGYVPDGEVTEAWPDDLAGLPGEVQFYFRALGHVLLDDQIRQEQQSVAQEFVDPKGWRASGKASKTWPDKEDEAWWREHLPVFLYRWQSWRARSGFTMAMLDDIEPAIEMDVSGDIGDIPISSYLDRVMLDPSGNPVVVDIKSGQEPRSAEQLGLYAVLLQRLGFPRPLLGYYWLARTGDVGKPWDLTEYTYDYFSWKYEAVLKERNEGKFLPRPDSPFCGSCTSRPYCWAKSGEKAHLVPRPWKMGPPPIKE